MTIALRTPAAGTSLQAWAEEMGAAAEIARGLAGTPFAPVTLQVRQGGKNGPVDVAATTATIAAALLAGREVGLEPMAALRSIHVIEGTPGLSALSMRALALARGAEMWVVEASAHRVVIQGRAANSEQIQSSVWDIARAERIKDMAGTPLTRKRNWQQMPQAMLTARATSELARLIAPEALLGLPYSTEELADGTVATEAPDTDEPPPAARTARRRSIPAPAAPAPPAPSAAATAAPAPGPEAQPAADPSPPPAATEPDTPMITKAQLRALHAAFRDLGITDKDKPERMRVTVEIIGRPVESANDLYEREASTVIDELRLRKHRADAAREQERVEAAAVEAEAADWDDPDPDQPTQAGQPDLDWGDDDPNPDD
jgi:hypothetical protein